MALKRNRHQKPWGCAWETAVVLTEVVSMGSAAKADGTAAMERPAARVIAATMLRIFMDFSSGESGLGFTFCQIIYVQTRGSAIPFHEATSFKVLPMSEACRVLVVDDDPMVREAYRMFLSRHQDHTVVGEARNGREAVESYDELLPDVVLMDLQMPEMSGVDAIREITHKHKDACIVALTTFGTQDYIVSALRAGAAGYLMKDCGGQALLSGIQQALAGEMPLAPGVRRELVSDLITGHSRGPVDSATRNALAPREKELLIWLGQGMTNAQIATKMFISEGSVKQYLSHIGDKLGLKSRTQILVRAIQLGLIDPSLMTTSAQN